MVEKIYVCYKVRACKARFFGVFVHVIACIGVIACKCCAVRANAAQCVHDCVGFASNIQLHVHTGTDDPAVDAPLDSKAPDKADFQFPVPPANVLEVYRVKVSATRW